MSVNPSRAAPVPITDIHVPDVRHSESLFSKSYGSTPNRLQGTRPLRESLVEASAASAIVTSCTLKLISGWLDPLGLPSTPASTAAEDVVTGKPGPLCDSLGRERLGLEELARALVVEDAPAGVKAGKRVRCEVLGLATTHDVDKLRDAGADLLVGDLSCVKVTGKEERGWMEKLDREDFSGQTMTLMKSHATIEEFHFREITCRTSWL